MGSGKRGRVGPLSRPLIFGKPCQTPKPGGGGGPPKTGAKTDGPPAASAGLKREGKADPPPGFAARGRQHGERGTRGLGLPREKKEGKGVYGNHGGKIGGSEEAGSGRFAKGGLGSRGWGSPGKRGTCGRGERWKRRVGGIWPWKLGGVENERRRGWFIWAGGGRGRGAAFPGGGDGEKGG